MVMNYSVHICRSTKFSILLVLEYLLNLVCTSVPAAALPHG
jgi:hypothetical protein